MSEFDALQVPDRVPIPEFNGLDGTSGGVEDRPDLHEISRLCRSHKDCPIPATGAKRCAPKGTKSTWSPSRRAKLREVRTNRSRVRPVIA